MPRSNSDAATKGSLRSFGRRILLLIFVGISLPGLASVVLPLAFTALMHIGVARRDASVAEPLAKFLNNEVGIDLPVDFTQVNSSRLPSGIDPRSVYELTCPPDKVEQAVEALLEAGKRKGWTVDQVSMRNELATGAPNWWQPAQLTDAKRRTLEHMVGGGSLYLIIYSPTTGRCFVLWFNT